MNAESSLESKGRVRWGVRLLLFLGTFLVWFAGFAALGGLILAAAIKNDKLIDSILPHYPRFKVASQGIVTLENLKYPLVIDDKGQTANVAVLEITDPAWKVFMDFLNSETAIRKSERNDAPIPTVTQGAKPMPAPPQIPINFGRIKTIITMRTDVARAGPKALVPPYSLIVIWPVAPLTPHRLYEFLSFEEFELDIHRMMASEIEEFALWLAVVAFLCELPANGLKWLARHLNKPRRGESVEQNIAAENPVSGPALLPKDPLLASDSS